MKGCHPLTTNDRGLRQPFPANIIPQNRLHPIYKVMESVTHPPTEAVNPYQGVNLRQFYPVIRNIDNLTLKGDHRFSDKDSVSGRFTRSRNDFKQFGGRFGGPRLDISDGFGAGRSDARIYNTPCGTRICSRRPFSTSCCWPPTARRRTLRVEF